MRGNGERIGPQNLPTSSVAGGIWNLLNQQRAQQRGAWPSATPAVVTDPYFMYVPLLLNTTSTNAQQNNTFLDSSTNNFTITRNGTPTQGAFTPYQPSGYWSGYFNGSTDYLNFGNQTALHLGSGNFTIESWIWKSANSQYMTLCGDLLTVGSNTFQITADVSGTKIGFFSGVGAGAFIITSSASIPLNSWMHIAFVRNSGTLTLYINGVLDSSATLSTDFNATTSFFVAHTPELISSRHWNGYISNFRIVKGTAVYTSAFTPSTTPLTAITNTSLLTLQSNRFIDNSSNAFAITVNGTPKVQAFQPFAPAASYSAATYGGSGYFGATTDYFNTASGAGVANVGTGNFTFEGWYYITETIQNGSYFIIVDTNITGMFIGYDTAGTLIIGQRNTATNNSVSYTFPLNQWIHFAVARSGTTIKFFINGAEILSGTNITDYSGTGIAYFGRLPAVSASIKGYYSNIRIVKGTAIYTAAFTPPTLPVTAVSGTSLLTNFTNAGIYDAAWQNNALTVGDAQASTTQYKWSPTSMKFDGTGDWLLMPNSQLFNLSGNFTIEFWIYLNSTSGEQAIFHNHNSNNNGILIRANGISPGTMGILSGNGTNWNFVLDSSGTVSVGVWAYVAFTRSGNVWTVYINGTSSGTVTNSATPTFSTTDQIQIGRFISGTPNALNGYIQDFRITNGVARTITTPTAAFPTR